MRLPLFLHTASNNNGIFKNVFSPASHGKSLYTKSDADLAETVQALLHILPFTTITNWAKGHYAGEDCTFKHELNIIADHLAAFYLNSFKLCPLPCTENH